jgi:hypothetical protein
VKEYDSCLSLGQVTLETIRDLEALEPTGCGNPAPVFLCRDAGVQEARRVGRDRSHLKLTLLEGGELRDGIGFGLGSAADRMLRRADVLFRPVRNEFGGRVSPQLQVQAIRPAAGQAEAGGKENPEGFFLDCLQENTDNVIYVFSVPYLEQSVLERIAAVLGESMQIRTITFVPVSISELKSLVEEELDRMELTADESAWQTFYERIAEEKSEGRFQGILSVDRIFDEMVYARLRAAAGGIRPESRVITAEDLKDLVRSRLWNKGSEEILRSMVGFEKVEEQLREACGALTGTEALSSGIFFEGESGTGRSTAARIMAVMLREKGFLEKGLLFEHRSSDLVVPGAGMTVPAAMVIRSML